MELASVLIGGHFIRFAEKGYEVIIIIESRVKAGIRHRRARCEKLAGAVELFYKHELVRCGTEVLFEKA